MRGARAGNFAFGAMIILISLTRPVRYFYNESGFLARRRRVTAGTFAFSAMDYRYFPNPPGSLLL